LTGKLDEKLQILIILKGTQNESFAQKFPVSLFPLLLPKHKNLLFFFFMLLQLQKSCDDGDDA